MKKWSFVLLLVLLTSESGCALLPREEGPNLGAIYNRSASHQDLERNPIIVIPGILGSRLVDEHSGKIIWGAFGGGAANPKKSEDAMAFAHPMGLGKPLHELKDTVRSDGALDRIDVNFFFLPIRLGAYYNILRALGVGGYRDQQLSESGAIDYGSDHFTCFQFDYDWRRDISENARLLHQFILEKTEYVQKEKEKRFGMKQDEVKFDIVAHSMGGLLARYYLRYGGKPLGEDGPLPHLDWAGVEHVERAVLIGTPSAGSVIALEQLIEGIQFAPILPEYPAAVLGTMPAIYQLLPRTRHRRVANSTVPNHYLDIFDLELWKQMEWGLADPTEDKHLQKLLPNVMTREERETIALEHLDKVLKLAKRFHEAIDLDVRPPEGLTLNLIAGDAVLTPSVIGVNERNGKVKMMEKSPGDGTVVRSSALMDERLGGDWTPRLKSPIYWDHVVFLFDDHIGLTKDPTFTDNILYFLLEEPR